MASKSDEVVGVASACIFCERKASSKEHAIPAWIAKRFDLKGEFLGEIEVIHTEPRKQHVSIASHRAMVFCDACQRHFKVLEDRVCDLLTSMARREPLRLDAEQQAMLARWGAKTAYALIACERRPDGSRRVDEIPIEHRWPVRWGQTPAHIYVAYANYGEEPVRLTVGTPTLDDAVGNDARRTYNAVLAFGQVLLKVFSVFEPAEDDQFGFPLHEGNPVFGQVSPARSPEIVWPPKVAVTGADAFDFVPLIVPAS